MRRLRDKFSESVWRSIFGAGVLALILLGAGSALAQPSNDYFTNATDLDPIGTPGSLTNNNVGATREAGEPFIALNPGGASVWYVWTAPTNCIATFDTIGSDIDTLLGVYTGTNVAGLALVADDDNSGGAGGASQVTFSAIAGTQYRIAVDGTNGVQGNIVLSWATAPLIPPPANDNFVNAQQIETTGLWGSVPGTNFGATAEAGEPSHAGFPATSSVWYKWIAPIDGEVQLDTIGSSFDTVLAVYTGPAVAGLNQVAANDDMFPTFSVPGLGQIAQVNVMAQALDNTNIPPPPGVFTNYATNPIPPILLRVNNFAHSINQPFSGWPGVTLGQGSGASGLRFNAKAGTAYYFAVDGKSGFTGAFQLNWAYHSSGVLRFASEAVDQTSGIPGMLLYQVAESEEFGLRNHGNVDGRQFDTTFNTDYNYEVPGLLVTITRVGGYTGRITVNYSTVDGTNISTHYSYDPTNGVVVPDGTNLVLKGDAPAIEDIDYSPVSGTLTFDDFEMSKTILIPVFDDGGIPQPNRDFAVVLFNAQRDPAESPNVSQPRIDPFYGQALVRILDGDRDPRGPSVAPDVETNISIVTVSNVVTTNFTVVTNTLYSLNSTNAIFNFLKSNYRIPEDVSDFYGSTPITVYVNRSGTNDGSASCLYRIDAPYLDDNNDSLKNERFPLEPGSDYATPDTNAVDTPFGRAPLDFTGATSGTLSWGDKDFDPKPITFTVNNDTLTEFNEDFRIDLYEVFGTDKQVRPVGMIGETTVTIMFDDEDPPAGSVDEFYNPDFSVNLIPPVNGNPVSTEPRQHPGTDAQSQVNALVVQADNYTVIGGDFQSYNGTPRNGIARIDTTGELDPSFDPGSGINIVGGDFVSSLAVQLDGKIIVGGSFTSFNGQTCGNIIRLNPDGSIDSSFAQIVGSGANGAIRSIVLLGNGQIYIGGDFTSFNGTARNFVARLNPDGSVDSTYDPGTALNNSVYTMSPTASTIAFGAFATTNSIFVQSYNVGGPSGVLTVDYNMGTGPSDMQVYYGNTNTAAGTGVLLFDTGIVSGTNHVVIPFSPRNGLSTEILTIVMNANGANSTNWSFRASAQTFNGELLTIGGDFTQAGGVIGQDHIARLSGDGSLDPTFDPNAGASGRVRSIITQSDGKVVVGGDFTSVNGQPENHIVRLNTDGTVDTQYFSGTGTDGDIYDLNYVQDTNGPTGDKVYAGGPFTVYNGTHRLGFARINYDGSLDTTFLDTAYNQFAGLPRVRWSDRLNAVFTSALQSDGNVMIGGSFSTVGGGQFDENVRPDSFDPNQYAEPKQRDGVRNRNNVARLIGGATPGPGNIGLLASTYPATKSQGFIYTLLTRTNGSLGYASANFQVQPGTAEPGLDYVYYAAPPMYPVMWEYIGPSWMHSDGLWGTNTVMNDVFGHVWDAGLNGMPSVIVTINNDQLISGDAHAQFQLANPPSADAFYLGGQNIPLGLGLARSIAPLNIADDTRKPGTFGFTSPTYSSSANAVISVVRTNGSFNSSPILVDYETSAGSNTLSGVDYFDTSGTLTFNNGETLKTFNVQIVQSNYISAVEKTVNLRLFNFPPGSSLGLTNAVLRIINPNFQGFLDFSATNYVTNLTAGAIQATVTRRVGSKGTLDVQFVTSDGTAHAGADYIGTTTNLHWDNGDVSDRIVTIPFINDGSIGGTKTFFANLLNPLLNGSPAPSLLGSVTNASLTIENDNNYGVFQFSEPSYVVNEASNGFATITVVRTGSALGSATLNFATVDGTAFAGTNYVATNGTVSFVPGQAAATFAVRVLNDGLTNTIPFYFNVILTNPSTGALLGSPTNSQVNIVDAQSFNRPPGSGDVTFNQPGINSDVLSVALQPDGEIVAGGNFTTVNGIPRSHFARFLPNGSLDTGFLDSLAGADKSVNTVAIQSNGQILLGGTFGTINGVVRNRIARVGIDGSLDTSFSPGSGADDTVFSVAETFLGGVRKVYAGGAFTIFENDLHPGIVRLNENGSIDDSFVSSGVNGTVYAIAIYPTNSVLAGKILIGGQFTIVDGVGQTNIARLNADGSLDTNFVVNADGVVRAIAIQNDNAAVIGGEFADVNGVAASRIARVNADGSVDTAFASAVAPGVNDAVNAIALQADNRIVIGGQFVLANGLNRNHITRLMPSGAPDPTINFGDGANGDIDTVLIQPQDQMILIGGGFTQYNDNPAPYLERIYGGSVTGSGAFEFTSAAYQVNENGLQAAVTIRRVGGSSGPNSDGSGNIAVQFSTTPGTALPGVNYSTVNTSVSFPAGEVLETVFVPIIDDNVISTNKTVNLALANPTAPAALGDQTNAVLTIVNTDNSFSFSSPAYQVAKNIPTGFASITIVRNGGDTGSSIVGFATTTNGTAVAGTDYTPTNASVTFKPGDTSKTVLVGIKNNGLPEGDRTVTMAISNVFGAEIVDPSNAVLTIKDTTFSPGQLYLSDTNYFVNEGDGSATITVLRVGGTSGTVSAFYYTTPVTATPGLNYISVSNTISLADGQTNRTFTVPLIDNNVAQGTEIFKVSLLTNLNSGTTLAYPSNAQVFIADNDSGFAFVTATNKLLETAGPASVTVMRIGPTNSSVSVDFATHDGTAVAGTNYTATSGTLTFNPGTILKSILVPVLDDPQVTGDLQFTIVLSTNSASPGAQLAIPSTNTVVIQDADAGLSFTNFSMIVRRNAGVALVTVVCSNPSIEPVIVDTNTVPLSVKFATSDGTAVGGLDYQPVSGTLVFTNGNGTNTFIVPIINNSSVVGDRTFNVRLFNPTLPGRLVDPSNESITIVDANAGFKFSKPAYAVNKTDGSALINVYRTGLTDTVSTVSFAATNGSAIDGVQYYSTNGTLTFTNGVTNQTFSVQIIDTPVVQPNKTVLLQLFNPSNSVITAPGAATLTIRDNTGSFVVPAGSALVSESGAGAPNGVIDSNETVTVLFGFRDAGGLNVGNLNATLIATNGVTPSPNPETQTYGPLISGSHSVSRPFTFTAQGTNGQQIVAAFQLQDGGTNIGTAVFGYQLGSTLTLYTNAATIMINDNDIASPYPSAINVSNVVGSILKATVTLTNIAHASPEDIDALLVSPDQQTTLFMAHAGGQNSITNVTITFDDAATNSLPQNGQIISGTNKPSAYLPVPVFP